MSKHAPYRALMRPRKTLFGAKPLVTEQVILASEPVETTALEVSAEVAASTETEPRSPEAAPAWEPTWTKTKLLEYAQSKGLDLTVMNTKAEIVAALTSAEE